MLFRSASSGNKVLINENEYLYWLTDERYTSYKIYESHKNKDINFKTACEYQIVCHASNNQTRIDRSNFYNNSYHDFNDLMLINNNIIDIHCRRPFDEQKRSLYSIIQKAFKTEINI